MEEFHQWLHIQLVFDLFTRQRLNALTMPSLIFNAACGAELRFSISFIWRSGRLWTVFVQIGKLFVDSGRFVEVQLRVIL